MTQDDIRKQADLLNRLYNWISDNSIMSPHAFPNSSVALGEIDDAIEYLKTKLNGELA